jgi:predicted transcriptional regulator
MANHRRYRRLPEWLAAKVRLRDKGICAACGVDTATLQPPWPTGPGLIASKYEVVCHIDHIVPVEQWPAGELVLDNLQSLCLKCHKEKTSAQAAQGAEARQQADMLRILRVLEDTPKMAGAVATTTGIHRRRATALLRIMRHQGLIRQDNRLWPYCITDAGRRFMAEHASNGTVIDQSKSDADDWQNKSDASDLPFIEIFL